MAYDLEEQEQIDELKAWWNQYGTWLMSAMIACLLVVAGFQGWRWYQNGEAVKAVTLYDQMTRAEQTTDQKKVKEIAAQVVERHPSTPYASMAALASAKASFETGDLPAAKVQLQWVIDRAKQDEMRDVARLRLAGVLLDEKKFADALKVLEAKHTPAYDSLFADLRGDILVTEGKLPDARTAYQASLEKLEAGSPYRGIVEAKLDALGEAK